MVVNGCRWLQPSTTFYNHLHPSTTNLYHFLGCLTKENPKILIMDEKVVYWLHNSLKTFAVRIIFTSEHAMNDNPYFLMPDVFF